MLGRLLFTSLLLLTACPDPTETPSAESSGNQINTPSTPNTNNAGGSFESDPNEARVDCTSTECVTVSGTFNTSDATTGTFRVDVQKVAQGSAPKLVHTLELQSGGDFSFELPKDYGNIVITGFIDQTGDGPTPDDAQGRTSLDIKGESITDITLDVALGNAPPPPPQHNSNPEGQATPEGQGNPTEGSPQAPAPTEDAPTDNPPAEGTPADNPPVDGPPADDVPADNPPVDGPPPDDAQ